jgi:hypothetical protein
MHVGSKQKCGIFIILVKDVTIQKKSDHTVNEEGIPKVPVTETIHLQVR